MTTPENPDDHQAPPAFLAMFRELVIAFQPRGIERDTAKVYWTSLGAAYTLPVLREATRRLMQSNRFFPTVAEWSAAARQALYDRILEDRADVDIEPCEWCADRGLVRVMYRSGEPYDIAVCSCVAGRFFRKAGPTYVRLAFGLTPDQTVAPIEDFDDAGDDVTTTSGDSLPTHGVFVYAFVAGEFLKIGFSTNLARRHRDLCSARGRSGIFVGRFQLRGVRDARLLERWLQHQYGQHRLDGEWFTAEPAVIEAIRALFHDEAAMRVTLDEARRASAKLQPTPAQENARVIGAVAMELLKSVPLTVPAETLADQLIAKCEELKIACDEHVAVRALRAAAWRLNR